MELELFQVVGEERVKIYFGEAINPSKNGGFFFCKYFIAEGNGGEE